MSLKEELIPYIDGNGLVTPNLAIPGQVRGSDNGNMFTSEAFILMNRHNELNQIGMLVYNMAVSKSLTNGVLHRAPDAVEPGPADDYYGVLACCRELGIVSIPRLLLETKMTFVRLVQPQIYLMALFAAQSYRLYHFPLVIYTALVIATSCMFEDPKESDPRRLAWLLIQATKQDSFLCRLAAKVWEKRLYKHYGPRGMQAVYDLYYRDNHPFTRYMGAI